jgi:toxin ParE1/3/4
MPKLRFSKVARADLHGIATYIARDKPEAARKWLEKIKAKCRLLTDRAQIGELRPDLGSGIRITLVGSYVIYFRHLGSVVEIARVIRGARDVKDL